jgi:hypothetical protein
MNTCYPSALWQFQEETGDLHVAGSMELVVDASVDETRSTPAMILQGLYGGGPLAGMIILHFHRLDPLDARPAFDIAARGLPEIYGTFQTTLGPYQDFIARHLDEFVRGKAFMTDRATADNTMHLPTCDGWIF